MQPLQRSWHAAAVINRDRSFFARIDGPVHESDTPPFVRGGDLGEVLTRFRRITLPDGEVLALVDMPMDADGMAAWLGKLRAAGWTVSDSGIETGWHMFTLGGRSVIVGMRSMINARKVPFRFDVEPADLARTFAAYQRATGVVWRGHAGMVAHEWIRRYYPDREQRTGRGGVLARDLTVPQWHWSEADVEGSPVGCGYNLLLSDTERALTDVEKGRRYVHHFDMRAMHVAAMGVGIFGWQAPRPVGAVGFDPAVAGYWTISADEVRAAYEREPFAPALSWVLPQQTGEVAVTTPIMSYLMEVGCQPEVLDAWLPPERRIGTEVLPSSGRVLRPFGELMRDLRKRYDDKGSPLHEAVKTTGNRAVGLFARKGGRIFRPDFTDGTQDQARASLLRKVRRSGYAPFKVNVDSVWIATDDDRMTAARKLGTPFKDGREVWQVGKFRLDTDAETQTMGDYLAGVTA